MRRLHRHARLALLGALIALSGCTGGTFLTEHDGEGSEDPFEPSGGSVVTPGSGGVGGDGGGAAELMCEEPTGGSPIRRLNKTELRHAIEDVYGVDAASLDQLPQEGIFGGYSTVGSALDSGVLFTERYLDTVEVLSADIVAGLDRPCTPGMGDEGACGVETLAPYAERLFRRQLTPEDRTRLAALIGSVSAQVDFELGMRAGVMATLTSTHFAFVTPEEVSQTTRAWTSEELATKLALALWLSVPDAELLAAARAGELETNEGLGAQIDRMMQDERFERFLGHVFDGWLGLSKLDQVELDLEHYGLSESEWARLKTDMREETRRFVRHVYDEDLPVSELFSADYSFLNRRLADHYGVGAQLDGDDFQLVQFPAGSGRAGVFTQGAVLVRSSSGDHASVISRGNAVLEGFLCQTFPDPPEAILKAVEEQGEAKEVSEWEKLQQRAAEPACLGCHKAIDPVGWSFANLDGLARWRDADDFGQPIQPGGVFRGVSFEGAAGLARLVIDADEQEFEQCMTSRMLVYASNRVFDVNARREDRCMVEDIMSAASTGSEVGLKSLVRELFMSEAFRVQGPEIIEGAIKE